MSDGRQNPPARGGHNGGKSYRNNYGSSKNSSNDNVARGRGRGRARGFHPYGNRGSRSANTAETPQVLKELKSMSKKVDSLESKLAKQIDPAAETEPVAEKPKFNVLYILAKGEASKIDDGTKFVDELRSKLGVDAMYIKAYKDMEEPKFNSNNSPTCIIFDLIHNGYGIDQRMRSKPKFGILDTSFYTYLKVQVKKIVDFRDAASEAYPDAKCNMVVLDRKENILDRSPAYLAATYAVDADSPFGLKESPICWYNHLQSLYWKKHPEVEVKKDNVKARIWEAVRFMRGHLRSKEMKKDEANDDGQPKSLDQLDDSEVAMAT